MKLMRVLTSTLFALSLANCSLEIGVEDLTEIVDFAKSSVISETTAAANGVDELVVSVELRHSDDTLAVNHTPTIELVTGDPVTIVGCTASNSLGISICKLKASVAGIRTIAFGNILIELTEDVVFTPPSRDGTFLQVLSAAQNRVNAAGYTVTTQLGAPVQGLHQTATGFEVFTSTTGAITPIQ